MRTVLPVPQSQVRKRGIKLDDIKAVKELLASYKDASRRALQLEIEIEQLKVSSMSPSGVRYDGMPRSGKISDPTAEYAERADALLRELKRQYADCLAKKKIVIQMIEETPSETEKLILWYRYIKLDRDGRLMRYEKIAVETEYSYGGVRHIIDQAHKHLAERWPEISKKYENLLPH